MPDPNPADNATRKSPAQPPIPETIKDQQTGSWIQTNLARGSGQSLSRIGRFEVRKLLGEGAFARVYLGFDPELEREVAIKVPKVDDLTPEFRDTFLRENRLAAIIHHPNICPIYDVGTDGGLPYIVMRMVPGTLAGLLRRLAAPLPPRNAVAITRKLALGLMAAHAQKVIHRDLKPANVLYDEANREVLIADFGLARFADQASEASNGVPKGTPAYMAPEQARGQAAMVGPLSDVYALGVILYEMLAGRVPFTGGVWEVMRDHCETPPVPPSTVRPGLDPQVDALVLKALAKHPADRYSSAKAFATALADYLRASDNSEAVHIALAEEIPEQKSEQKSTPAKPIFKIVALPSTSVGAPPKPAPPEPAPLPTAKVVKPARPEPSPPKQRRETPRNTGPDSRRDESDKNPRPTDRGFRIAIWVSLGLLSALIVGIAAVLLVVSRSRSSDNIDETVRPQREKEPVDAELQRDWDEYKQGVRTTGSLPFVKKRGPTRWQAWKNAAEANNSAAMVMYARCLGAGIGVEKDQKEAGEWYRKAAELGEPIAMNNLGSMYEDGEGVTRDYAKAREWYEKAAVQGLAQAQFNLGYFYGTGKGGTRDYAKAREWYEKAAVQDHAQAQANLGVLYHNSQGVGQDYAKAKEWYEKAAAQNNAVGQNGLGVLYHNGQGITRDYAKAKEWYEKAAAQNNENAQFNLGLMRENGNGVTLDMSQALEWYRKAADQGHDQAKAAIKRLEKQAAADYNRAEDYYYGRDVPQDYAKAKEWYEKAAVVGHASAQCNLGYLYDLGKGVTRDYAKAKEWYEKAAAQGNAQAQNNLGMLYRYGDGVTRDYAKAKEWYEKAAAQNNKYAQFNLGVLYENGYGVTKNVNRAIEWYHKAADQGHEPAKKAVERLEKK